MREMISGKKGIELSVNFIVTLVLAIVVFGFGLYMARTLFSGSDNFLKMKSQSFESQLEAISCDGTEFVCVGSIQKKVKQGGIAVFTLSILNENKPKEFNVYVEPVSSEGKIQYFKNSTYSLGIGETVKVPIAIHPLKGSVLGTHAFKVTVNCTNCLYDGNEIGYGSPILIYPVVI
ncbi:MAG: hypothetical protein NTV63_05455 [Candidatus Woesearchaeota archaeon]|nr:hypothetical protein [Candidatus Woesearchaeota archaeon]